MSEKTYTLTPRDLLFMKDARPMAASDAGLGANWPRPDQLWNALINAFHRQWPDRQPWEGMQHTLRNGENQESSCRFGALKTCGPFPSKNGGIYYPFPLDWNMEITRCSGTDLPRPLTHAFRARRVGKTEATEWISAADYARYLAGESFDPPKVELYDAQRQIGIGIDPQTQTTGDGHLYQAEYLRLRDGVGLAFSASCDLKPKGGGPEVSVFDKLGVPADLIFGGQQGVVRLEPAAPINHPALVGQGRLLRWTLLTPALFPAISADVGKGIKAHVGGWLPNWVDAETGQVMLPRGKIEKQSGESRDAWRQRVKAGPKFGATLIAARIGKPLVFSGWDQQTGPKPTMQAVPAGSVYVFQCADEVEARELAGSLSWPNRRSTQFGEKGFGVGVCSLIPSQNP